MKNKTIEKLERRVGELEDLISRKGVGADYVKKAQRVQRDVNLGLILGTVAAAGLASWILLSSSDE